MNKFDELVEQFEEGLLTEEECAQKIGDLCSQLNMTDKEISMLLEEPKFQRFSKYLKVQPYKAQTQLYIAATCEKSGKLYRQFIILADSEKDATTIICTIDQRETKAGDVPIIPKDGHVLISPLEIENGIIEI